MKTRIPPHLLSFRYVGPPAKRRSDVSESGNDDAVRDSRLRGNDNRDSKNDWKYCVMPAFCRRMAGFTLFEMLIAVSIFALMGVIGFSALGQMTRTGQSVADANDRLSDMQFAVVYFNRDWIQVSPRKIRNQFGDEESNIIIADNSITFTRSGWSNLLGNKRSTLQRVQYLVVDEQLVRRHWRSLDQGVAEQPIQVVLLDDVESMEVELQNSSGRAIRDWPVEEGSNDGSPVLLAFRLELPDMGEIRRLLEIPKGAL